MTERLTELSHPGVSAHRVQTPATEPGACLLPQSGLPCSAWAQLGFPGCRRKVCLGAWVFLSGSPHEARLSFPQQVGSEYRAKMCKS